MNFKVILEQISLTFADNDVYSYTSHSNNKIIIIYILYKLKKALFKDSKTNKLS